jgi:UDP-3-O-[3-hydroxymyristoyl] N-acetylglucosamine deacetylase
MMQATLRDTLRFEGVGLHTGAQCAVEVRPANPGEGLSFVLGATRVPATVENVRDTSRATVLGFESATVSTTEHLLSALFALGVTNAEIHVRGPEIPALDGSAAPFAAAIDACGLQTQPAERKILELNDPVFIEAGDRLIVALPAPAFRVRFVADFAPPIGTQYFDGKVEPAAFRSDVAGARTFGYLHEVESLLARGLARGGNLENALVFAPDGPMQPLRWPDEAVRHKVLDLIGDLALLGAWPQCEIVAVKSGHELHAALTRALRTRLRVPSA